MNFLWFSFSILSILFLLQHISGDEYYANRKYSSKPLALIQEGKTLKCAIPERYEKRKAIAKYTIDKNDEQGVTPQFKTACAEYPYTEKQKKIDEIWREQSNIPDDESELFYMREYTDENMQCRIASKARPGPSIKNTKKKCAKEGEIYEVGYPVITNEEELLTTKEELITEEEKSNIMAKIQFVAIYEICYSKGENPHIIYTNHRIRSPSLLLLEPHHNAYRPWNYNFFFSHLDFDPNSVKEYNLKYSKKYVHQYVPRYDMPSVHWENTTFFHFNFISIDMNPYILEGMTKYDEVIRLFSQQTKKPLTIYSGTLHKTKEEERTTFFRRKHVTVTVPVSSSLWRVIFDDENKATILVTRYFHKEDEQKTYVCKENRKILETYAGGGYTYICSVNLKLLKLLQLPELTIDGALEIKYTTLKKILKKKQDEKSPIGVGENDAGEQYENVDVNISDFGGGLTFAAALLIVDSAVASAMQSDGALAISDNADGGADDGADFGGDGDGGGGSG